MKRNRIAAVTFAAATLAAGATALAAGTTPGAIEMSHARPAHTSGASTGSAALTASPNGRGHWYGEPVTVASAYKSQDMIWPFGRDPDGMTRDPSGIPMPSNGMPIRPNGIIIPCDSHTSYGMPIRT